jgi:nucleotide-binding universal stress UspA family protein
MNHYSEREKEGQKMYKKIMVPLDGSELAECVLPHVESIAKGCSVPDVVLIRVVEPVVLPAGTGSDGSVIFNEEEAARVRSQSDLLHRHNAEDYLKNLAGRIQLGIPHLHTEVVMGKPAYAVAAYAEKSGVDLIVIATHGRSGVSRWVWGSVADRILRSACVPVLMIRAPGCVPGI